MARIVAALFEDRPAADRALARLRERNVEDRSITSFALGPPGMHHAMPTGGDVDADPQARGGAKGAVKGAVLGGAAGVAAGLAAVPLVGPAGRAAGVGAVATPDECGARLVEAAQGEWAGGRWTGCDALDPPADVVSTRGDPAYPT